MQRREPFVELRYSRARNKSYFQTQNRGFCLPALLDKAYKTNKSDGMAKGKHKLAK
jgi:hypothetical protein